jgi:vacuolar protein sorting-associated protein 13A/C
LLQEIWDSYSSEEQDIYLNFNLVLSDVSAFLVDGDYHWNETSDGINLLPVIDKCGIALKLQQVKQYFTYLSSHNIIERLKGEN